MDREFASGASGSPPTHPASPSVGYPTSGNPGLAVPATKPGPWWYHMVTEEIRSVLVAAGITPDGNNVTQLAAAIQALINSGAAGKRNYVQNGDGRVAQRASTSYGAVNTPIYGQADRWLIGSAGATTQSAGNLVQGTLAGSASGLSIAATGVTLTGAGSTMTFKHRIEAKDVAGRLNGKTITVQAKAYHDAGAPINWTATVNRPTTTADTFSAVTQLGVSGNQSVPNTALTQLSYTLALGAADADKGLEIVFTAACGAVTTKQFHIADVMLTEGATAQTYDLRPYQQELAMCQRYFEVGSSALYFPASGTGYCGIRQPYKVTKRATPTLTIIDGASNNNKISIVTAGNGVLTNNTDFFDNGSSADEIAVAYIAGGTSWGVVYNFKSSAEL